MIDWKRFGLHGFQRKWNDLLGDTAFAVPAGRPCPPKYHQKTLCNRLHILMQKRMNFYFFFKCGAIVCVYFYYHRCCTGFRIQAGFASAADAFPSFRGLPILNLYVPPGEPVWRNNRNQGQKQTLPSIYLCSYVIIRQLFTFTFDMSFHSAHPGRPNGL